MAHLPRLGFVGLGAMGGAIARRIIRAGYPTTLWARREASLSTFAQEIFTSAPTLAALGRTSDVVGICVFDDDGVREVLLGAHGILAAMAPGGIVLIHSTVAVETCREIEEEARPRGISVLDAPISGSPDNATAGTLAIMLGGDSDVAARAMPILKSFGEVIHLVGALGSGQRLKVLSNIAAFCNGRIACLAIEMGQKLGLDVDAVISILRSGGASSHALDILVDGIMPNPAYHADAKAMIRKDMQIYQRIWSGAGLEKSYLDTLSEDWLEHLVPEFPLP